MKDLRAELKRIASRNTVPAEVPYRAVMAAVREALLREEEGIRPKDDNGLPGGLILLVEDSPVVVVPDLHGRCGFLLQVLNYPLEKGRTVLEALSRGCAQVLCLGDGFHGEARASARWYEAHREFLTGYRVHDRMDEEMSEDFSLMEMVMLLKTAFPRRFHFLKGNHENISNENGDGNYAFGKFVNEGEMVAAYVRTFYSPEFMKEYYAFEKLLPLLTVGRNFLASHAEPARLFTREEVVSYRGRPEVVYGLTWTDNGEAREGSVQAMLEHYLGREAAAAGYYFGGHRPIAERYGLRASGRYVQIHNPRRRIAAVVDQSKPIELERAVIDLGPTLA